MTVQFPFTAPPRSHRNSRQAFTLLELLLAISLVVVVAVILSTTLAIGFRARAAGEQAVENARSGELVMEAIRADLQSALPPSRGKFFGSFEGFNQQVDNIEADDLVFYGTAAAPFHPEANGLGNGEIKQFELTCYQPVGSTDHVLVRRTFNNLLAPDAPGSGVAASTVLPPGRFDEEILCRNVQGFWLEYFDGADWQQLWDSTQQSNSLPLAVRITLTVASADKNATGPDSAITFVRVFQLPCSGVASGTISGVSAGSPGAKPSAAKAPGVGGGK